MLVSFLAMAMYPFHTVKSNPLAPAVLGANDGEVRRLMGQGEFSKAAQYLAVGQPEHQLVRGYLLFEVNDGLGALAALQKATPLPASLTSFYACLRAEVALLVGDADDALKWADQLVGHPVYSNMAERIPPIYGSLVCWRLWPNRVIL